VTLLPESSVAVEEEIPASLWNRARKLATGRISYALADQVTYSFGNLVVAALINRHATPWEFGIYILTQRVLDILIQMCNNVMWGPYIFNRPGLSQERQKLYLGSVFAVQMIFSVLMVLLLAGVARWCSTPSRGLYYGVFQPLILTSAGIVFREFTRRMYFADLRMKEAFWTDVATVVLQIAGVEWLYLRHSLNIPNTLFVLCAAAVFVSLWWLLQEWKTFAVGLKDIREDFVRNLHLGGWFVGSNMVFIASSQWNPWVLSALMGGVGVGMYSTCEQVINIPRVALVSVLNMMSPIMAQKYADGGKVELDALVKRFNRLFTLGSVLCAAVIMLIGPFVAKLIFKHIPGNARTIMVVLALNFIALAATLPESYGLSAINRAGPTFYANLAGFMVQAGTAIWLIRSLQLPGAAAALLLGSIVVIVVRHLYYRKEFRTTGEPVRAA
jgi:O-antigen/teichoic acid export membrane protein